MVAVAVVGLHVETKAEVLIVDYVMKACGFRFDSAEGFCCGRGCRLGCVSCGVVWCGVVWCIPVWNFDLDMELDLNHVVVLSDCLWFGHHSDTT